MYRLKQSQVRGLYLIKRFHIWVNSKDRKPDLKGTPNYTNCIRAVVGQIRIGKFTCEYFFLRSGTRDVCIQVKQ